MLRRGADKPACDEAAVGEMLEEELVGNEPGDGRRGVGQR